MNGDLKLSEALGSYLESRSAHVADAEPGVAAAAALSSMTDAAVRELAAVTSASVRARWAVVALGGWGAGRLLPDSDLDILLLCESSGADVRTFAQALLYPMWDAGLKVGHQVRTPKEHHRAAAADLKSLTAALRCRPIAGDLAWASVALAKCVTAATKRQADCLARIRERERDGDPYRLEADLKVSAGGRRDHDELAWTTAVLERSASTRVEVLADRGLLSLDELSNLEAYDEVLTSARWVLQREGWGDTFTADGPLSEQRQQAVQRALVGTACLLDDVRARLCQLPQPGGALGQAALFEMLDRGPESYGQVCRAASSGRLDHLVPGFSELMPLRRPGLGHELTVGAHCVRAACLVAPRTADPGPLGASARAADLRTVQTAALLHDIGKRSPEPGHAERGADACAEPAAALLGRSGSRVPELVRLHLLLAETATTLNLDDEDSVLRCAGRVRDEGLVAPLHVLTAVDSIATGRATWSPWKSALVATLVSRLSVALSPRFDGTGLLESAEKTRASALALLDGAGEKARRFVEDAPVRYLASHSAEEVERHAKLIQELSQAPGTKALIAVGADPTPGTHRVTIVAAERPDLLSRLAGALTLAGLDILALDAYRGSATAAVHTFVVASAVRRPVTSETYARLERLLASALGDRLSLEARIRERRSHYPPKTTGPARVTVDDSGLETGLRVRCPDRPGLLYDVSRTVEDLGLGILWVFAETIEGVANDLFHICGPDGGPPERGLLGHACARVRELV